MEECKGFKSEAMMSRRSRDNKRTIIARRVREEDRALQSEAKEVSLFVEKAEVVDSAVANVYMERAVALMGSRASFLHDVMCKVMAEVDARISRA